MELIRTRSKEFNIQPERIGMIGFSVGGGPARAAMAGEASTRPNFVALIYGAGSAAQTIEGGAADQFMDRVADWMRGNGWLAKIN